MEKHPDTPFQHWLERHEACEDGRQWCGSRTLKQAWAECPRGDWMLWLVAHSVPAPKHRTIVELALAFAERVQHKMSQQGKDALALVRRWLDGERVSEDELRDAADAAAYYKARTATFVADAALFALRSTRESAQAAGYAAQSASFAADDPIAERQRQADLVRQTLYGPLIDLA